MLRALSLAVVASAQIAAAGHSLEPLPEWEYWMFVGLIVAFVLVGGVVAGLTIGLMSIDTTNIAILKASGTPAEKRYAERIEPIRKNGHLLLVTLLLTNTIINETLPILFDYIHYTGWKAVLGSTVLIVIFGEIIPQAACSRYGLQIGAFFAWPVRILIWILYILSYPISSLLDYILGHEPGQIYRHAGLKELLALHGEDHLGPLSKDEVTILNSVLDLRNKTVFDVMTHMENVFTLSVNDALDRPTIEKLIQQGYSRIPIHLGKMKNQIIGALLVKKLVLNDPDDCIPIEDLKLRKLPRVTGDTPLYEMLHIFESGASHMAVVVEQVQQTDSDFISVFDDHVVYESPMWKATPEPETKPVSARANGDIYRAIGIVTLEDIIEEMIGGEIIDETDLYVDMISKVKVTRSPKVNTLFARERLAAVTETDELNWNLDEGPSDMESQPLLSGVRNAKEFAPIKLPVSCIYQKDRRGTDKRQKSKEMFHAADLAFDLSEQLQGSSAVSSERGEGPSRSRTGTAERK